MVVPLPALVLVLAIPLAVPTESSVAVHVRCCCLFVHHGMSEARAFEAAPIKSNAALPIHRNVPSLSLLPNDPYFDCTR